jgi:hypothetical protein
MEQLKLKNSKIIVMQLFDDIGFDLLPKIPVRSNTPIITPAVELSSVLVQPRIIAEAPAPDLIPAKKAGTGLEWFLFGLIVLGTIGATVYMANKDSAKKEISEN